MTKHYTMQLIDSTIYTATLIESATLEYLEWSVGKTGKASKIPAFLEGLTEDANTLKKVGQSIRQWLVRYGQPDANGDANGDGDANGEGDAVVVNIEDPSTADIEALKAAAAAASKIAEKAEAAAIKAEAAALAKRTAANEANGAASAALNALNVALSNRARLDAEQAQAQAVANAIAALKAAGLDAKQIKLAMAA